MGACYLLPKIIGLTKATELLMTGDFMTADEAQRIGFCNQICAPEELEQVASQFAMRLVEGPANGIAVTKQQINSETLPRLRQILDEEANVQAKCMLHPDFKEGYTAFTEKRKPKFL